MLRLSEYERPYTGRFFYLLRLYVRRLVPKRRSTLLDWRYHSLEY